MLKDEDIHIGDDVVVAGKVKAAKRGLVKVESACGACFWTLPEDIKTIRPNGEENV